MLLFTMAGEGKYSVQLVSSGKELGALESNLSKVKGDSSDLRAEIDALKQSLSNLMNDPNRSADDVTAFLSSLAKLSQDVTNRLEQQKSAHRETESAVKKSNKAIESILAKMKSLSDEDKTKYGDAVDGFKKRLESLSDDPAQAAQEAASIYKEISDILSEIIVKKVIGTQDASETDDLYKSRFSIDRIGRRNLILSGGDYENYTTDEGCMEVAQYEHWKRCRLTDTLTLKTAIIPWLDVNQKVSYQANYLNMKEAVQWIIKNITIELSEGTMNITMARYYPYYPFIVQNKY